jgi:hypothetical protein
MSMLGKAATASSCVLLQCGASLVAGRSKLQPANHRVAWSLSCGGLGKPGKPPPAAYYAADYCTFPVAKFEASTLEAMPLLGSS